MRNLELILEPWAATKNSLKKLSARLRTKKMYRNIIRGGDNIDRWHFGCGSRRIPGWINSDLANSDIDIDLSSGNLPFRSNSLQYVVSQQVIEHLIIERELRPLLREIFRTLKPGGELWLSAPDIEKICLAYVTDGCLALMKGRLKRFPSFTLDGLPTSHLVNDLFHQRGEHKNLFDFSLLSFVLEQSGFVNIVRQSEAAFLERFPEFPMRDDDEVAIYVSSRKPH